MYSSSKCAALAQSKMKPDPEPNKVKRSKSDKFLE